MNRAGLPVQWIRGGRKLKGVVASWDGDPDHIALVMDRAYRVYPVYVEDWHERKPSAWGEAVVVRGVEGRWLSRTAGALLGTKRAKVALADARRGRRDGIDPSPGAGHLEEWDIPTKLADRENPSQWSHQFETRLTFSETPAMLALDRLRADYPQQVRAYWLLAYEGERADDVAALCGVSVACVYQWRHRIGERVAALIPQIALEQTEAEARCLGVAS